MHYAPLSKKPLCNSPLFSFSPENFWKLIIFSVLIYTSHYSMFQKFHSQWETRRVRAAKAEGRGGGGRKQSRACAASSDSITAPVKDHVCLPRLSEARPVRERGRERVTDQRERERETKQNTEHREMRQSESRFCWWWHEDLINYHFYFNAISAVWLQSQWAVFISSVENTAAT